MFNLKRWLTFYVKALAVIGLIGGGLFALGMLTELHAYQVSITNISPIKRWDFWLFSLLNMIPGIVALVAVCWMSAKFVRSLYGLKNTKEGWDFVLYRLIGRPSFPPFLRVVQGTVVGGDDNHVKRAGGPGGLLIANDSAVVTEKSGKLNRVLAMNRFNELEPFEKVWDVVDLRRQDWSHPVSAMTQEGIPVTCDAEISFRIDSGNEEPTTKEPYPVIKEAVFKATTCKWIRESDNTEDYRLMTWPKRVIIGDVEGTLRSILPRYSLDKLIEPEVRREIQEELEQKLTKPVSNLGVEITRIELGAIEVEIELGAIEVEDEVTRQWIDKWQAKIQDQMTELEKKADIEMKSIKLEAGTETRAEIIKRFADAFVALNSTLNLTE